MVHLQIVINFQDYKYYGNFAWMLLISSKTMAIFSVSSRSFLNVLLSETFGPKFNST